MELTAEQQAIVAHDRGPALVFAVAGAGKTTAMVRRIERLVREGVFPARQVLATTFGRAAKADIARALSAFPHCRDVQVLTLHQVGYRLVRSASRRGASWLQGSEANENESADRLVLQRALGLARSRQVDYRGELDGLDLDDFLSYVGACKGNLAYANLEAARLPDEALAVATQAVAPPALPWYLDLYRIFEEVRVRDGFLTFDDMLLSGWEALVRYPEVLREAQAQYRCVLVDEFQDVNLAQAEILHLITAPGRDYMAIGDDDQTIYEWRGASPRFILGFERRYAARKYLMTDNFRCRAPQVALANRVIRNNRQREPKQLGLTRGFEGLTQVHVADGPMTLAAGVVNCIQEALDSGHRAPEVAVLVRQYAQTPFIERFLADRGIRYQVVGSQPFYARQENATLLAYVRLALLDAQVLAGTPLTDAQVARFVPWWNAIANRPVRYLTADARREISRGVTAGGLRLARALVSFEGANDRLSRSLLELAEILNWLGSVLDRPASLILGELERKLGYADFLRRSSGFAETGEGRAQSVLALVQFAGSGRSLRDFLRDLDGLVASHPARGEEDPEAVRILTVHRAKGLEWPVVIVPGVNEGNFPMAGSENVEEERRLLYVAITRAREVLHLHARSDEP
ncbi:MAG TPA: ATP-dependent helicase, partial [Deinococcales bacterium]|nr:ATP-dependent helicase [Deinococcales bacterium]